MLGSCPPKPSYRYFSFSQPSITNVVAAILEDEDYLGHRRQLRFLWLSPVMSRENCAVAALDLVRSPANRI